MPKAIRWRECACRAGRCGVSTAIGSYRLPFLPPRRPGPLVQVLIELQHVLSAHRAFPREFEAQLMKGGGEPTGRQMGVNDELKIAAFPGVPDCHFGQAPGND